MPSKYWFIYHLLSTHPSQDHRLVRADAEVPVAEDQVKVLVAIELIELEALFEILGSVDHKPDQAQHEAAEDDKEVGHCHLVWPSLITVLAVVEVGGLHPSGQDT